MANNSTATLYIRSRSGYRKPPKKLTDLPKGESFYLFWYEENRRKSRNVGRFADAAQVAVINQEAALRKANVTGDSVPNLKPIVVKIEYVRDAVTKYLDGIADRVGFDGYGASPKTLVAYRKRLSYLLEFDGVTPMAEVGEDYFRQYRSFLRKRLKTDRYAYNVMHSANTFFRAQGVMGCGKILAEMGFAPKVVKAYSQEELNRFYGVCTPDEELVFKFFLHSMGREREVIFSEVGDLLFDESVLWIQPKPHRKFRLKGKRSGMAVFGRKVPLPRQYMDKLRAYCEGKQPGDLLFPNANGEVEGHFLRRCQTTAKRAGMAKGWALHRFRKTGATMHYKSGVPVPIISQWLGHTDLITTQMYLDVRDSASAQMVDTVSSGALVAWA